MQPSAQEQPVGEPGGGAGRQDVEQKGVPREQRRGFDDDLQPPRLAVPESVGVLRRQFEDVASCGQVRIVGAGAVLDVVPLLVDVAAVEPVGVADFLGREERQRFVADVEVALLVVEDDPVGVVELLLEDSVVGGVLYDAVDLELPEHQLHGPFRDLGQDALGLEVHEPQVSAEIEHAGGLEDAPGMKLLGLHLVGAQVGDGPVRAGEDERKAVGGGHPHVAFPVLHEGGDLVAGETVFQGVGFESFLRMIPQQALRTGPDPQPVVPVLQQADRAAERGGRQAVRSLEAGPPFETAPVDREEPPPEDRRQHRRIVETDDVLYVAAFEACAPQTHAVVYQEPRGRRRPHVVPGVLAEAVGRKAFRKQGIVGDRLLPGVAAGGAVVDVDPEAAGRIGEERRYVLAVEPLHEGAVLHRVPFQVELGRVGQHALETASDPARAVLRDRDGVDELAKGLFAQPHRPGELLFIGIAHGVAAVERTDPEIVFRIGETAGKVAGVVESGRSP